jgi:hypothetical protein
VRCLIIFFLFFIMHYLTYVFIPLAGDIEGAVARALAPFDEARVIEPWKEYLDAEQITLMARHYRVRRSALNGQALSSPPQRPETTGREDARMERLRRGR